MNQSRKRLNLISPVPRLKIDLTNPVRFGKKLFPSKCDIHSLLFSLWKENERKGWTDGILVGKHCGKRLTFIHENRHVIINLT